MIKFVLIFEKIKFYIIKLQSRIYSLRINKSPDQDDISNEFFKSLTPKWLQYLKKLFNTVMNKQDPSAWWSQVHTHFLQKKFDTNNPENYRPIALLNYITKM